MRCPEQMKMAAICNMWKDETSVFQAFDPRYWHCLQGSLRQPLAGNHLKCWLFFKLYKCFITAQQHIDLCSVYCITLHVLLFGGYYIVKFKKN